MSMDPLPFWVSLRLGIWVTLILACVCFPLAWTLAQARGRWAIWVESLASLPLVLSPTALGFYLLLALSPRSPIGHFFESAFHVRLAFSFAGIVIGGCVSSLPFHAHRAQDGHARRAGGVARGLLHSRQGQAGDGDQGGLPNMKTGLVAGIVTTFAHSIGEFGVILMIGGSVPGQTKTVSIAVYERAESLDFSGANAYAIILVIASYIGIFALNDLQRREARR